MEIHIFITANSRIKQTIACARTSKEIYIKISIDILVIFSRFEGKIRPGWKIGRTRENFQQERNIP